MHNLEGCRARERYRGGSPSSRRLCFQSLALLEIPDTDKLAIPDWHLPDLLHTGMPTSGSNNAPLRETVLSLAAGVYFRGLVGEP